MKERERERLKAGIDPETRWLRILIKMDVRWNDWIPEGAMGVVGRMYSGHGWLVLSTQMTTNCCYLGSFM